MLQQMSSPPSAQVGEVATLFGRYLEGRAGGDVSSEASSDAAEDLELPQCKIKRNYNCTKCTFYTQNPRAFLVHTRDTHFVKLKIFDCPHCVYASKHHQKLLRHIKMVHEEVETRTPKSNSSAKLDVEVPNSTHDDQSMRIEDMLEEVEDCEDMMMEVEEGPDYSMEQVDDIDIIDDLTAEQAAPSNLLKTKNNVKFFTCDKCTYVTHIRARFTKHVKYHSMPMIKCTMCDFRTPYKWNLDRHMKNHGGSGSFHCSMCNFTADIKQSLTVHEMNHHTPPAGQSLAGRRRNRVGASDTVIAEYDAASVALPKEEEGSGDSRSSHSVSEMGLQYADREIVSCKSDSNDGSTPDASEKRDSQSSPNHSSDESKQKNNRKIPRPIPQLIPLNSSTPNQKQTITGEPPQKKFKESSPVDLTDTKSDKIEHFPTDISLFPVNNLSSKEVSGRKKNESFFDRLKERLLAETGQEGSLVCKNCGFESKCLSEHSVHEKNCSPQANRTTANASHSSLSSTRCQNCRHRCKSSADLYVHMKTCGKNDRVENDNVCQNKNEDSNDTTTTNQEKELERHPMENVVFVWNNIDQDTNKFDTPLGININDDSTLAGPNRSFDVEIIDENESMNLSPSQAVGRKVFKCPHCPFFSTTASRFHVHIVGHLNKKPFECSLCKYKSNWRWDITKHIKLKSARDPEHNDAKVLMTDETGRRNYSKYNKFLAMPVLNEYGENEFHYLDCNTSIDGSMEIDDSFHDMSDIMSTHYEMQPLNLQTQYGDEKYDLLVGRGLSFNDMKKPKKTLWKCKKCNYKDPSKEALLEHVREHSKDAMQEEPLKSAGSKKSENTPDPADLAYRCGHCHQLSNWKHVIQRHCRLKHDGIIKVITTVKPKPDPVSINDINDTCNKCPFRSSDKKLLIAHLQQHQPSPQSVFKCYFCPYFVKDENELSQHLLVHGITEPEDYISKAMDEKSPLQEQQSNPLSCSNKRHRCTECPYETNSKSQYMYHEQFHRTPSDTPYKCPECNYSVSKRHLLHQHLRVHGIITKRLDVEYGLEQSSTSQNKNDCKIDSEGNIYEEIPYVWVSAKNEFHKMYKCRYCSYVNSIQCKIPNHENLHFLVFENNDTTIYKCLECKFTCNNASRLAEHSKSHGEIYGRIYCPVENDIPDEQQIAKLRKVIEMDKGTENFSKEEGVNESREIKMLYFCHKCPARFFEDTELESHKTFHNATLPNKCTNCEYSVSEENYLTAHETVHTDEYHTKTKILKFFHNSHPTYRQPQLEMAPDSSESEIRWISIGPPKVENIESNVKKSHDTKHVPKQYFCKQCPAKFFKSSALNYHAALHGGEGDHKCKKCNYAVKNIGNLAKHEILHEKENKPSNCDYESGEDMDYKNVPLSGTDLFQRKTEAQKRVLIDKDKLVKPNDHFPPVLQADPQFGYLMHGNPEFIYPTYLKNGRQKEKRYKCHKCPSAFEKREQYKIHLSLHGSKQRYKCELCDYSVKYYANYVQHMRKHQMNDEAQAERKKGDNGFIMSENQDLNKDESTDNIKLAIKTMPKGPPKSDFQQFSISDQQTLRLLQRRRSINDCVKDLNTNETSPTKERKMHMCLLCPYTNQRQDSLTNHYRRHGDTDALTAANHKCSYCDLVVVQSHFLREHLKTHFNYHKNLTPECFVANEDVGFTINKIEDESSEQIDLKLNVQNKIFACKDEKMYVKIATGELLAAWD